jgi:hypothetical protein
MNTKAETASAPLASSDLDVAAAAYEQLDEAAP